MAPGLMVSTNTEVPLTLGLRMERLIQDKLAWLSEPLPGGRPCVCVCVRACVCVCMRWGCAWSA
jgi:hypothetical protein